MPLYYEQIEPGPDGRAGSNDSNLNVHEMEVRGYSEFITSVGPILR